MPERLSPDQRLVAALFRLAIADARRGDREAAAWLRSRDAADWLLLAGCDHAALLRRLARTSDSAYRD